MYEQKPEIVQMSDVDYHNDPCDLPSLSASIAHLLTAESPAHAFEAHPKLGGRPFEPTTEMDYGTLGHAILLKAGWERIKVVHAAADLYTGSGAKKQLRYRAGEPFEDWKMGAAQDMRDEQREAGNVPVLQRDVEAAQRMADMARLQFKADWLIADPEKCKREHVLLWTERASNGAPVQCRAKLDLLSEQRGIVEDLKCAMSSHPKKVARHLETYGGAVQSAAYTSAVGKVFPALLGRVQFKWTFVATSRPFCVLRRRPGGTMRQLGEALWQQAIDRWALCLETGEWPGYGTEERAVQANPYTLRDLMEAEGDEEEAA